MTLSYPGSIFKRVLVPTLCTLTLSLGWGCGGSSRSAGATQVPSISSFAASIPTIAVGSSTNLMGHFVNGTGVITPGNISVNDGVPVVVSPATTTIYTLTVTPSTGAAISQQATVTVNPLPSITSFVASPATIQFGGSAILTGVFAIGSGVITPGSQNISSGTAVSVTPATTTTYTLTVTLPNGQALTQTATITVLTQIAVNQSSLGPVVSDNILGMNMGAWYDPTNPAIIPAFAAAGIKSVRWPGGSWADNYDWENNTQCGGWSNPLATWTNFVNQLAVPAGLDIVLTANYGENATCNGPGDPAIAAAWAANALANNIKVSHITVGNEVYGSWETDKHSSPHSAAQYARATATEFYPQIKAANPKMLVGVDVNPGDSAGWDTTVLAGALYDFVEFHYYPETPGKENDSFLLSSGAPELTRQINLIKTELATVGKPDTPIYVGEIGGAYSNPGKQSWSIIQGLYAGQVLGEMMNDGIQRLTWWIGFGNCNGQTGNDSASVYGWQNFGAYNVFSNGPSDITCSGGGPIGTMSPTARAFQLLSSVALNGEHVLTANVHGDTADVRAYAVTSPNGGTALVLFNLNQTLSETVAVTLSGQTVAKTVSVQSYDKSIYDQTNAAIPVWAPPTISTISTPTLPLTLSLTPWSMNVVILH